VQTLLCQHLIDRRPVEVSFLKLALAVELQDGFTCPQSRCIGGRSFGAECPPLSRPAGEGGRASGRVRGGCLACWFGEVCWRTKLGEGRLRGRRRRRRRQVGASAGCLPRPGPRLCVLNKSTENRKCWQCHWPANSCVCGTLATIAFMWSYLGGSGGRKRSVPPDRLPDRSRTRSDSASPPPTDCDGPRCRPLELLSMNRAVRSFDLVDSIHGYEPRN